jgi:prepilin-type N-terminal cleavage/methylation domain-containing protein
VLARACSHPRSPITTNSVRRCEPSAFTLIELLVVIAIISVLLVALIPAVTSLSKSNNLNSGGRLVTNLLAGARSEAINQRRLIQIRVVTKWVNSSGIEDTSASYRKFSVWRLPQPDDTQQSSDPNDPYVQISKWETLPSGTTFESNTDLTTRYSLPINTTDPRYPGTYFLDASLTNRKTNVRVSNGTADVAYIEFTPTGATNFTGSIPTKTYVFLTEGFWDGQTVNYTHANHPNWFATTVDTLMGRVNVLRP